MRKEAILISLEKTLANYHLILGKAAREGEDKVKLVMRELCKHDLFFLLYWVCGRKDMGRQWILDRCREVEESPDGYIDLWARYHYKSSIITFGKCIQDILNDPDTTIGIFSYSRPIAKPFLRQIKVEFETNERLKALFPDILYLNPKSESPKWSEDDGIIVRRRSNPKEATVEAWGLVEGQCTGKHFRVRVYDDIVVRDSVTTPEMIKKTTAAWEDSLNLGVENGAVRYAGTRWHYLDTYKEIMDRNAAIPRIYPGTDDGTEYGRAVLWDQAWLEKMRDQMGVYGFSCQVLLKPVAREDQRFMPEWIKYWPAYYFHNLNRYILVDPANEKQKRSDYTVMVVFGTGSDNNYYIISMLRDRMNLTERANALIRLHQEYRPIRVGYQKYGIESDIQFIEQRMKEDNYRFSIVPLGGKLSKADRIERLVPLFQTGRVYLPESCIRVNYEGRQEDLAKVFINEEYIPYPQVRHDDILDCMQRMTDENMMVSFPDYVPGIVGASKDNLIQLIQDKEESYNPLTYGFGRS